MALPVQDELEILEGFNDPKRYIRLVFEAVRFFHFLATPPPEYRVRWRGHYAD